jgi:hypothetical protein
MRTGPNPYLVMAFCCQASPILTDRTQCLGDAFWQHKGISGYMQIPVLKYIDNKLQIQDSLDTFNTDYQEARELARELLCDTTYWVYSPSVISAFALE